MIVHKPDGSIQRAVFQSNGRNVSFEHRQGRGFHGESDI
jgi:hypothetical protein